MAKIVFILLLIFGVIAGVYLATNRTSFFGKAAENAFPQGVIVSNITDKSLTISWYSQENTHSDVMYGPNTSNLSSRVSDDRGSSSYNSHHVTLKNLSPNTEYFFKISSEQTVYKAKTAPPLSGNAPQTRSYKGILVTAQREPSRDSIVYFNAINGQLLSTPADDQGKFEIRLLEYRSKDLTSYLVLDLADSLDFYAQSKVAGGFLKTLTGVRHDLEILLEQRYIPFFAIQYSR